MFKSVILCGYGKNLYPLIESNSISTNSSSPTPISLLPGNDNLQQPELVNKSTEQIKALLPLVGSKENSNKKIIDFILNKLEEEGLNDVLILTPTSISQPLSQHIKQRRNASISSSSSLDFTNFPTSSVASTTTSAINSTGTGGARLEVQDLPDGIAKRGTVDVLRWAVEKGFIKTDFIVFPCDLLLIPNSPTTTSTSTSAPINMSISKLLNEHIIANTLITTLFYERESGNVVDAAKDGPSEILTIYDKKSSSLLDLREMEEYLTDDEIPISTRLLSQFPTPTLSLNLLPTHVYIFSAAILPYLSSPSGSTTSTSTSQHHSPSPNPSQRQSESEEKELSIIRTRVKRSENFLELVGYFSRLSWKKRHSSSHSHSGLGSQDLANSEIMSSSNGTNNKRPSLISRRTSYAGNGNQLDDEDEFNTGGNENVRGVHDGVKVLVWKATDGFCARGNTVQGWVELNRAALKTLPPLDTTKFPLGSISVDSYLHPSLIPSASSNNGSYFGDRTSIKRSIILGKNCSIGRGSKLIGVILMDGVKIGENVKLENCILSNNVQIRDRAVLKDCDLGRGVIVLADVVITLIINLPIELIDKIIELSVDETLLKVEGTNRRTKLCRISLVSKSFTLPAQRILWKEITTRDIAQWGFMSLIQSGFAKEMVVEDFEYILFSDEPETPEFLLGMLLKVLNGEGQVLKLSIEDYSGGNGDELPVLFSIPSLKHLKSFACDGFNMNQDEVLLPSSLKVLHFIRTPSSNSSIFHLLLTSPVLIQELHFSNVRIDFSDLVVSEPEIIQYFKTKGHAISKLYLEHFSAQFIDSIIPFLPNISTLSITSLSHSSSETLHCIKSLPLSVKLQALEIGPFHVQEQVISQLLLPLLDLPQLSSTPTYLRIHPALTKAHPVNKKAASRFSKLCSDRGIEFSWLRQYSGLAFRL